MSSLANPVLPLVFTSPEIATSNLFKDVILQSAENMRRLRLVAVDELHCVMSWGDRFRPAYRDLHILRSRIDRDIPWFGASATLRPHILEVCLRQGGFRRDTHIIYENLNRQNIYCDLRPMQFPARSMKDLFFLFPPPSTLRDDDEVSSRPQSPEEIIKSLPKTIVFFRSTDKILNAEYQLVKALASRYSISTQTAQSVIEIYYSNRSEFSKLEVHQKFIDPNSDVRILLATDAVGMGIDIPCVEICIQIDVPDDIDILLQRLGRAGRDPKLQAHFIWFVPPNLLPTSGKEGTSGQAEIQVPRIPGSECSSQGVSQAAPSAPRANNIVKKKTISSKPVGQDTQELPPEFRIIFAERECLRRALWTPFNAGPYLYGRQQRRCCSLCHPEDRLPVYTQANEPVPTSDRQRRKWKEQPSAFEPPLAQSMMSIAIRKALADWATLTASNLLSGIPGIDSNGFDFEVIMPKSVLKSIGKVGNYIENITLLRAVVPEWTSIDELGQDVVQLIQDIARQEPNYQTLWYPHLPEWKKWLGERGLWSSREGSKEKTSRNSRHTPSRPVGSAARTVRGSLRKVERPRENILMSQGPATSKVHRSSALRNSQTVESNVPDAQTSTPPSVQTTQAEESQASVLLSPTELISDTLPPPSAALTDKCSTADDRRKTTPKRKGRPISLSSPSTTVHIGQDKMRVKKRRMALVECDPNVPTVHETISRGPGKRAIRPTEKSSISARIFGQME